MSHFPVAVFSESINDIEKLLAPFQEEVESDSPYAEFVADEDCDFDETAKKKGYWYNPQARWDWWLIGGRWSKQLKLRTDKQGFTYALQTDCSQRLEGAEDGFCDQALASDVVFEPDQTRYQEAERLWEVVVEGQPEHPGENIFTTFNAKYYLERYKDKEDYATSEAMNLPHAFVTADGAWHEAGVMGWFGMDNANIESRMAYQQEWEKALQEAVDKGQVITMVDCHI